MNSNPSPLTLGGGDARLARLGTRDQRRWERLLERGRGNPAPQRLVSMGSFFSPRFTWVRPQKGAALRNRAVGWARLVNALPFLPRAPRWMARLVMANAAAGVAGVALAATLAVHGYVDHPATFWSERIEARKVSPLYDARSVLVGAVDTRMSMTADEAANFAYIPLDGPLPDTFVRALLALEQKHLQDGWRTVCGIDLPALARPLVSLGRAGGSGLNQQLAKQLMAPDWGNEKSLVAKGLRWARQLGASCALHGYLAQHGGAGAPILAYAEYVPMLQGQGTLRGIKAAAHVLFNRAPLELDDAQQLILAASVKEPLRVLPPDASEIECARVYPKKGNPRFEEETWKVARERANQCRVVYRALSVAPQVLQDVALDTARDAIRRYQREGIVPANPFEPVSTSRLVNLSSRARAALPDGILQQIRKEAEGLAQPGDVVLLSLDAVRQHRFTQDMKRALADVQQSPAGRRALCLPLVPSSYARRPVLRACGIEAGSTATADVLALKFNVRTGGIQKLYASSSLLLDASMSIGSLAKWVILAAAIADGFDADSLVCPRSARDQQRVLHRVAVPLTGFAHCDGGRHAISLRQATATSDNLAFYDLAKALGEAKLGAAARALGLMPSVIPHGNGNLAYDTSFGTLGTTPRLLAAAAQSVFAVAYGLPTVATAPRVLQMAPSRRAERPDAALLRLLPEAAQRETFRQLLEAPLDPDTGTLRVFRADEVDAGKSGTTQSEARDGTGHRYVHAKWAVSYQKQRGEANLFMVSAPLSSLPLAHHALGATALAQAHRVLLSTPQE